MKILRWIALVLNTLLLLTILLFVGQTGVASYDYIGYSILTLLLTTLVLNLVLSIASLNLW